MTTQLASHPVPGGRHWDFTHNDITYRLESRNGADKVWLYFMHNGQPVSAGARYTLGRSAKSVAQDWADEIAGDTPLTFTVREVAQGFGELLGDLPPTAGTMTMVFAGREPAGYFADWARRMGFTVDMPDVWTVAVRVS